MTRKLSKELEECQRNVNWFVEYLEGGTATFGYGGFDPNGIEYKAIGYSNNQALKCTLQLLLFPEDKLNEFYSDKGLNDDFAFEPQRKVNCVFYIKPAYSQNKTHNIIRRALIKSLKELDFILNTKYSCDDYFTQVANIFSKYGSFNFDGIRKHKSNIGINGFPVVGFYRSNVHSILNEYLRIKDIQTSIHTFAYRLATELAKQQRPNTVTIQCSSKNPFTKIATSDFKTWCEQQWLKTDWQNRLLADPIQASLDLNIVAKFAHSEDLNVEADLLNIQLGIQNGLGVVTKP